MLLGLVKKILSWLKTKPQTNKHKKRQELATFDN